eukprot:TRINITY_DN70250_c0_g1_i1.p1 TRINITY_DN70250_c0_g1~~TRINITY_DN70250_c0_g1_i1.p1  ORF type:complete len:246 (-),score=31.98 TRINITY_DN70250_c0_g1_i1:129-866(-)
MGGRGGARAIGADPFHRQKFVEASISGEAHLARCTFERFDLSHALRRAKQDENTRHHATLQIREPTAATRSKPFGTAAPPRGLRRTRSAAELGANVSPPSSSRPPESPGPPSAPPPRRRPGVGKAAMTLAQDPCNLPDLHGPRIKLIQALIDRQEETLIESRECLARRVAAESSGSALPPTTFDFDRQPPGEDLSEHQAQYFPRSAEMVKACGGGKDPRFGRPFDDVYAHREALCRLKACLSSKP